MWQWKTDVPGKSANRMRKVMVPPPGVDRDGVAVPRLVDRPAVDLGELVRVDVDVERVHERAVVDDRPFLERAELDDVIDAVVVEPLAVDQESAAHRHRQRPPVVDRQLPEVAQRLEQAAEPHPLFPPAA
jgi:hypothetical protein